MSLSSQRTRREGKGQATFAVVLLREYDYVKGYEKQEVRNLKSVGNKKPLPVSAGMKGTRGFN